ncbi:uncharacterized protein LOC109790436 [Cajanus cajan]|uniref:RNase H type-1 domain-containing protein n=1 Tax=Cajanus cajan TaxID=3821 RepID=A0A151R312_CAJCA|nr:uncharacterized protein LOC109790436 [Cajanus cajan]KYP36988.1 hypothetical protein KK1_041864 [Cajanus cajan]
MGTGGILQNHRGTWILDFSSNKGHGDAQLAKLLAVRNEFQVAWDSGFTNIVCESDALNVVNVVNKQSDMNFHPHAQVIFQIRSLLVKCWTGLVTHTPRGSNSVTDILAKLEAKSS